jgi:hypothetical protein
MTTISQLKDRCRVAHELRLEIAELEERTKARRRDLRTLLEEDLPAAMMEAGVDQVGVEATGNHPPFEVRLKPYAAASISSDWPSELRARAFQALAEHDADDLIKVTVSFSFSKGKRQQALEFARQVRDVNGWEPSIKEEVHHSTLSAWLRDCVKNGRPTPPLDLIGGRMGTVAEIKERT